MLRFLFDFYLALKHGREGAASRSLEVSDPPARCLWFLFAELFLCCCLVCSPCSLGSVAALPKSRLESSCLQPRVQPIALSSILAGKVSPTKCSV